MLICYSDVSDQISGCSAKTNFERTFWQHNYVMLFVALDLVVLSQKREHTTTRLVPKRLTRLADKDNYVMMFTKYHQVGEALSEAIEFGFSCFFKTKPIIVEKVANNFPISYPRI